MMNRTLELVALLVHSLLKKQIYLYQNQNLPGRNMLQNLPAQSTNNVINLQTSIDLGLYKHPNTDEAHIQRVRGYEARLSNIKRLLTLIRNAEIGYSPTAQELIQKLDCANVFFDEHLIEL